MNKKQVAVGGVNERFIIRFFSMKNNFFYVIGAVGDNYFVSSVKVKDL